MTSAGPGRVLGAILAGGQARRFGADKARAIVGGALLLDRVAARLGRQCEALVVVGRDWPGLTRVDDCPRPGLGPLGGLAGALIHARAGGYALVLTTGCDLPDLPLDMAAWLKPAPAVAAGQPLLGLWPVRLAEPLLDHLAETTDHSLRGWIRASGATIVPCPRLANINSVADLAAWTAAGGA